MLFRKFNGQQSKLRANKPGVAASYHFGEILRNIKIQKRLIFSFLILSLLPLSITGYIA